METRHYRSDQWMVNFYERVAREAAKHHLFVLFETGLQMMADNPTLYYRNDECTRFITQVPQTWDETIALDFLQEDKTYRMTAFEDGINADRQAMDYRKQERTLKKGDRITVRLARNGGFAAVIR